jgi:benzoyl-CoA reductase/2-hydroxyglutaryl-CoA dehydratase subunit BcrC/BadD/HgdB
MNENKINLEEINQAIKTLEKISSKDITLDKVKILIDKSNITNTRKIKENDIEKISRNQLRRLSEMMV